MKICENGVIRELSTEEIADMEAQAAEQECNYWLNTSYAEAVNSKIRERYTDSQEFAILRQKEEKPEEYAEYYAFCEECKSYVKAQQAKYQ